ncbi:KilA-N domain-containing protein [Campylobacter jejuni]|nr:KilA-N domain-containing protein [Campylobacter jejuni]
MKTEVILKRELLGGEISQKSKSEYFSATDLFRVGNKWRSLNGLKNKTLEEYNHLKSTKEFEAELKLKYETRIMKRGRGQHLWVHPILFIDMALWLSPNLKIEVYEWLFDNLIKYRNNSGDSYKKMCGALFVRANKSDYIKNIQKLCKLIQVECGVIDWNTASENQLKLRDKIHENISLLADVLNNNREAIRIGILKAKEDFKKDL